MLALSVLFAAATAPAQQGTAIELDSGPIVSFERTVGGKPHRVELHVANCDGDRPAQVCWQNQGNTELVARLDRTHLLIASYGTPYALIVLDTKTGKHRVLAEGSPHEFVAVHGDDVLYLGDNRWGKGDNHLFARSWRVEAERRQLAEPVFESVPIVKGNLAIGVTAGASEVWAVSLTRRKGRRLYELPDACYQVTLALAPGGQRIAVGANKMGLGHLAVVDLGSAKLVRKWDDLDIHVSPISSFTPTLRVGWFDDEHVVSSETRGAARGFGGGNFSFVRRSLETGEVTDEAPYGPVELHHSTPTDPNAPQRPAPTFWIKATDKDYLLMQKGTKKPLAAVPQDYRKRGKLRIAPGGTHAVVMLPRDPLLVQLHRPGKSPLALSKVGGVDWKWFPAAPNVESSK